MGECRLRRALSVPLARTRTDHERDRLDCITRANLQGYATSEYGKHSLIAAVNVVRSVASAAAQPAFAKTVSHGSSGMQQAGSELMCLSAVRCLRETLDTAAVCLSVHPGVSSGCVCLTSVLS